MLSISTRQLNVIIQTNTQTKKDEKKNHLSSVKHSVCLFLKVGSSSTSLTIFSSLEFTNKTACRKIQKYRISVGVNACAAV